MKQEILSWSYREGDLRTYLASLIKSGYTIVAVIPTEYRPQVIVIQEALIVVNS